MVIKLALPPAAAVLMLNALSCNKRSNNKLVSPRENPWTEIIAPLR